MSSALDQLFLFLQEEQQKPPPAMVATQQQQQQFPATTSSATSAVPSPSPVYPGGGGGGGGGGGSAAAVSGGDQKRRFSLKAKPKKTFQQQEQQPPTIVAESKPPQHQPVEKLLDANSKMVSSLFVSALVARSASNIEQQQDSSVDAKSLSAALSVYSQRFSNLEHALFSHLPQYHRQQEQHQQTPATSVIPHEEIQQLVNSSFSVPELKAALFCFLSHTSPSPSSFHQMLLEGVWQRVSSGDDTSRRRERPEDDADDDVEGCQLFCRISSALQRDDKSGDDLDENAVRALVQNFAPARRVFIEFALRHVNLPQHSACCRRLATAIPAIVGALSAMPTSAVAGDDEAIRGLLRDEGECGQNRLLSTLVRRACGSSEQQQQQTRIDSHLGDSSLQHHHHHHRLDNNDTGENSISETEESLFTTLVQAFRSRLASSAVPGRLMQQLQAIDATARRSIHHHSPIPCAPLSILDKESGAAAAERVATDVGFASDLLSCLQRVQRAEDDQHQQQQQREQKLLGLARTALLFIPVFSGEKQAMMSTSSRRSDDNSSALAAMTTTFSPIKAYQAALATAVQIVLKISSNNSIPSPSSFHEQLVDFLCNIRAVIHAAINNTAGASKVDPLVLVQALDKLLSGAVASLLQSSAGILLPFMLQSLLAAVEVIIFTAALQEQQLLDMDRDETGEIVTASAYLGGDLAARRFLDALFGRDVGEAKHRNMMMTLGDDDDDGDDDQKKAPVKSASSLIEKLLQLSSSSNGQQQQQQQHALLLPSLQIHIIKWCRTLLFALGRIDTAQTTLGDSSSMTEDRGEKQATLLNRMSSLLLSDDSSSNSNNNNNNTSALFACLVLKELLGATQQQVRISLQCLRGDRAQSEMGTLVIKLVKRVLDADDASLSAANGEVRSFLKGVVVELVPLMSTEESNTLKDLV